MTKLLIYKDHSAGSWQAWGDQLAEAAHKRDMEVLRFDAVSKTAITWPYYLFARLEQQPSRLERGRSSVLCLTTNTNCKSIVHPREYEHYERKDLQTAEFMEDMPDTYVIRDRDSALLLLECEALIHHYPFISKSAQGSSSSNVRMIYSEQHARDEIAAVFSEQGLATARGRQKDYLIWQKWLPGNDYSYRVVVIGSYYWLLRVYNRDDKPFASGSGKYTACKPPFNSEEYKALQAGVRFFTKHQMSWCGIDLLYDYSMHEYVVLETTIAWNLRAKGANEACAIVDAQGQPHPKGYHGRDQWELLLDEIQEGMFG